ncbi:MAG: histidine kinase [Desulfuromonadaceae bacterium GWC2_58_13]|nr:MAG: histidine kinase [Desulfuromonadaceae bacterium GWC2_58_13]
MFFKSLVSRVIILNILLLTVGIGIFTLFHIRREHNHLVSSTRENAGLLLSTIEKAIFNAMRTGQSEEVQAILQMVGENSRLLNVRIFHPNGTILKSARSEEIGRRVGPNELAIFQNHQDYGIFRVGDQETLGVVKSIVSDERCFLCHGSGRKVVGVLNLNYSLSDTTQKLRDSTQFFAFSTIFIIVLLSVGSSFLLLRFVRRPIQSLAGQMAKVEQGDLSVRITPRFSDEIGSLARSFNSMVDHLEMAKKELEQYHYQQMVRADRLASVGEMASGVAHEIKNPLAGISSAISVLADDFAEDDPRKAIVGEVLEQITRLNKTATDLLFFGKPGDPEFSFVDLNALIKKTLFFIAQHPEAKNIHRVKDLDRELPPVWADEKQIQQVLFNVMINGIQSMTDGGTLTVETLLVERGGQQYGQIMVSDTGEGIPPDRMEKIFVPFYTTKTQGTGLGLAICRKLMEQQGGTIRVDSHQGEGTVFIIELPVVAGGTQIEKEDNRAST